jgi:hypothetical protein
VSDEAPKPPTTSDLLSTLIDEIRGLRADMRIRGGLPDTKIGKAPKNWKGPSYEGKQASDCPSDFLLEYAGYQEWRADAGRAEGNLKYVASNEREALICRRWAAVNKGVKAPEKPAWGAAKPAAAADDVAPTTQDSRREQEPAAKPKWGATGGAWGAKKASGA